MKRAGERRSSSRAGRILLQAQAASPFVTEEIKSFGEWGREVTIALSILILVIIIATMIIQRRRLLEPTAKWLLLLGIIILPSFVSLTGAFTVFSMAERKEFCGSCHPVMDPYINNLLDRGSDSLAAVHNTNRYIGEGQCYACHVTYGFNGTFKAKVNGLLHVWKFYTKSWKVPIDLYEKYSNVNCLHCHAGAKSFEEEESHTDIVEEILSDEESCLDCHGPAHPTEKAEGDEEDEEEKEES